jgi:uncharacterized RDD family membrane protein YckC
MNARSQGSELTIARPRAGFWRRFLSFLIDCIVVILPFQLLAAILFSVSAGTIQMNTGFAHICAPEKDIPQGLDPPPPHDANFANVCRTSFFGATTGAVLTVARVTRQGHSATWVSQGYMLDKDGTPIKGTSIDGIVNLALLAYLFGMVWKTGRTLGARVVSVRVVDVANPDAAGVPLGKTIIRYLAILIGAVPVLALFLYQNATKGGDADAMFTAGFVQWFVVAGVIGAIWMIVLLVQIAWKSDPFYDRLAGTAVLRNLKHGEPPPVPSADMIKVFS